MRWCFGVKSYAFYSLLWSLKFYYCGLSYNGFTSKSGVSTKNLYKFMLILWFKFVFPHHEIMQCKIKFQTFIHSFEEEGKKGQRLEQASTTSII